MIPRPFPMLMGMCVLLLAGAGCSAFKGSRRMDMSPFAENTSIMFAEAAKVSRPFNAVYLRPYGYVPEIQTMRDMGVPLISGLRSLVLYSHQVVSLNMARKSDKEKNRLLADYLEQATSDAANRETLHGLGMTDGALDSTLTAIREAKTFLDGVGAATPLVNVVVNALLARLDNLNAYQPVLLGAIDAAIERRYHEKRAAFERLTALQARVLLAATWVYQGRSGDPAARDSLLAVDPSMQEFIPPGKPITPGQWASAEAELSARAERVRVMIDGMEAERSVYIATQQELAQLRANLDDRIRVARNAVVVWGQSHRNLGAGVPVPPLINLSAVASKAGSAVPLP